MRDDGVDWLDRSWSESRFGGTVVSIHIAERLQCTVISHIITSVRHYNAFPADRGNGVPRPSICDTFFIKFDWLPGTRSVLKIEFASCQLASGRCMQHTQHHHDSTFSGAVRSSAATGSTIDAESVEEKISRLISENEAIVQPSQLTHRSIKTVRTISREGGHWDTRCRDSL
ncbi:hypothetical protein COOONC_27284 [Cooperia oncophora]